MLRVTKKPETSSGRRFLISILAVVAALLATSVIIFILGYNPLDIYWKMLEGATATPYRLKETINKAIPLVILSLGVGIAFRMKFWNIGAEGQYYMGAFAASFLALNYFNWPAYILLPAMFIAALVAGGIWCCIPAVLKARFGTNETLVTLMMNYIAISWITYLQHGPWKDPGQFGFPKIANFEKNPILPNLFGVHIGWVIALVLVVLVYILLRYTKLGYEISVLGESVTTARYAGINVTKVMLLAVFLSGGLCGATGMIQASAIESSLSYQMSGGLGFTAIITAWLARLNPFTIIIVSFLFSILLQGGTYLQGALQIPASIAGILQGSILFCILGSEFFTQYKVSWYKAKPKNKTENKAESQGGEA